MPWDALRGKTVMVTGADGMLGRAFREVLAPWSDRLRLPALSHQELDVTDPEAVMACTEHRPDFILHCAGLALADQCEREPDRARSVHVEGSRNIGGLARAVGARVFYPQSVFIFDGREIPVTETTIPAPRLVYGRVKLEAERILLSEAPGTLSVRMAGFFGGDEKDKNFVGKFTRELGVMLESGATGCEVGDRMWQPTYTLDLARNVLDLLDRKREGIYHMGAFGEASFFEVATACVEELGLTDRFTVRPCPADVFGDAEAAWRPRRMVTATPRLDREGLNRQRPWRDALREYLHRPFFDPLRSHSGKSGA